jgi:hemolysin type calcium-binding protein
VRIKLLLAALVVVAFGFGVPTASAANVISCYNGNHCIGTSGPDNMYCIGQSCWLSGRGSNDKLYGYSSATGHDVLEGEGGIDLLVGYSGKDAYYGNSGDDTLDGYSAGCENRTYDGGANLDTVHYMIGASNTFISVEYYYGYYC